MSALFEKSDVEFKLHKYLKGMIFNLKSYLCW